MAWLDDRIYAHPKIRNVPRATRWEYAAALAYASGFGTGGVLSAGQLRAIDCTNRDRELLIAAGLWEDAGRGAIRIHDWTDHNGKRDAKREADRLRKRAARAKEQEMSAGQGADKHATDESVSAGQASDGPRVRDRRRPPDDGSDRVTEEGKASEAAAELQDVKSTSSTTAANNDEEPELEPPQDFAAAAESPTEQTIRAACEQFGSSLKTVEPLARQLTAATFTRLVTKMTNKVHRGSAREPEAHFVFLLQEELADQAKQRAKLVLAPIPTRLPENERSKPATGEERIRVVVPTLAAHPFERVEQTVRAWAKAESWTDDQTSHRLKLARQLHTEAAEPELEPSAA